MELGLRGRVAVVTGSSRGIGHAVAERLAIEGAAVVINGRRDDVLQEAARQVRERTGTRIVAVAGDLSRPDVAEALIATATEQLGRLDILVLNVSHPRTGAFAEIDEAAWKQGFEEIFLASQRLLRLALPAMRAARWGRIVSISSSTVKEPVSPYLVSSVCRTALAALLKSLAEEVGGDGIRVNAVAPGLIRSDLGSEILERLASLDGITAEEVERRYAALTATKRIGEPDEVAALVAYLCSDLAGHITGQHLLMDGGKGRALF